MIRFLLTTAIFVGLSAAEPPKTAPKDPALKNLPAAAEKIGENVWRYKDPQGKTWVYQRNPFGLSRTEEQEREERPAVAPVRTTRVVAEKGEEISFERDTPFGKSRWTKKKAELSDEERAALEDLRAPGSPNSKEAKK